MLVYKGNSPIPLFSPPKHYHETFIHETELDFYDNMINYSSMFGFEKYSHNKEVKLINESSNLEFEGRSIEILSLPGHSPGHLGFYFRKENFLILLFKLTVL